jgi:hypothetical protein
MSLLLVTYDLKVPGRNYEQLYDALKQASGWWHHLESTWVIQTSDTVQTWSDRLLRVIDNNDRLLIVDITGKTREGWLTEKAWEWLRNHDR